MRQRLAEFEDLGAVAVTERELLLKRPALKIVLERFHRAQFLFPELFETARHQAIFGLDLVVLALGALRFKARAFQA